jgi:large subunit ribosomal protein L31
MKIAVGIRENKGDFSLQSLLSRAMFVGSMKAGLHPEYNETTIICACGAAYKTRSTRDNIKIGICSACHPFFTGEQKFIDTAGRIEKFTRRYGTVRATRATKPTLTKKS